MSVKTSINGLVFTMTWDEFEKAVNSAGLRTQAVEILDIYETS